MCGENEVVKIMSPPMANGAGDGALEARME